jgi:hypothetical protein
MWASKTDGDSSVGFGGTGLSASPVRSPPTAPAGSWRSWTCAAHHFPVYSLEIIMLFGVATNCKIRFQRLMIITAFCAAVSGAKAGGVTLITHGFNSDVTSWIIPMQGRIARYGELAPTNTVCYEITITKNAQGQYVAAATFISGTNPVVAASGEILLKLNWSTLSGLGGPSTTTIAIAAAQALLNTNLIPALGGRSLVEGPLHLVGHSRGASVVAELSRLLGAEGIWVDHLTALDPVPVASFGDPAMKLYANVLYVDNYWQNLGVFLDPQGQPLTGAYNRKLTNLSGAAASAHSDVHLWYHGTIDFNTPITVDGATITSTERQNWWTTFEERGTNAGFRLSLIGGGDRLSSAEPAGTGNGRIRDGFNQNYSLGAGQSINRIALPVNSGAWPNPILLTHTATNPLPAGSAFDFTFSHQSGTNQAANVTLQLFLDRDANPWSGNETLLYGEVLGDTGSNATVSVTRTAQTDTAYLAPGTYRLLTKLSRDGHTRFLYASAPVSLTPSVAAPSLAALGVTNGAFALHVAGFAGQTIVTEASTNLEEWTAIATNTLSGNGFDLVDTQAAATPARFFRAALQR